MAVKRIHIFGGAGSGKTTLAREIAEKLGLPHHELDDIYYTHVARRERRDKSERDRLLQATASNEAWVMEGIFWQPWVVPSLDLLSDYEAKLLVCSATEEAINILGLADN